MFVSSPFSMLRWWGSKVKRFTLLPHHLSMEKGELTNTLKIRRRVLNENYKAEIDKMYEE